MKTLKQIVKFIQDGRKMLLGLLAGSAAVNSLPMLPEAKAEEQTPPNIIFILADDLGWTDINCHDEECAALTSNDYTQCNCDSGNKYDSTYYQTENLWTLRESGIRFTNAYVACPYCRASRAGIHTGKHPLRNDMIRNNDPPLPNGTTDLFSAGLSHAHTTIAEALKEGPGNYTCGAFGKWHVSKGEQFGDATREKYYPDKHGFDKYVTGIEKITTPNDDTIPDRAINDDNLTSYAIEFMRGAVGEQRPFFLYLPFDSVHINLPYVEEFIDDNTFSDVRHKNKYYKAYLQNLDDNVGRVLNALDPVKEDYIEGLDPDNTYIIFFSDNGGQSRGNEGSDWVDGEFEESEVYWSSMTQNYPLRAEKFSTYEGGIRVPLIVKGPGVTTEDPTCHIPVSGIDILPTILQMAYGENYNPDDHYDIDGKSFTEQLSSPTEQISRPDGGLFFTTLDAYWQSRQPAIVATDTQYDGYKLIKGKVPYGYWPMDTEHGHGNWPQWALTRVGAILDNDSDRGSMVLKLNGIDDYAYVYNFHGITGGNPRTFCAWIRPEAVDKTIVAWGPSTEPGEKWDIRINSSGHLELDVGTKGNKQYKATSENPLLTDRWQHVAVVLADGEDVDIDVELDEVRMFVNGTEESVDVPKNTNIVTKQPEITNVGSHPLSWDVHLGSDVNGGNCFDGFIDDVRIYDYALSEREIWVLGAQEEDNVNLVAHWTMDRSLNVVPDSSINGYDGSLKPDDPDDTGPVFNPLTGMVGGAMQFDGEDDYIYVGTGPTSVKTVAFWVNLDSTDGTYCPIDLGGDYIKIDYGDVSAVGTWSPTIYIDGDDGTDSIDDTGWYHIAAVTPTEVNASGLHIGCREEWVVDESIYDDHFVGLIDDVRLYGAELSGEEGGGIDILANYTDYELFQLYYYDQGEFYEHDIGETDNLFTLDEAGYYYSESIDLKAYLDTWLNSLRPSIDGIYFSKVSNVDGELVKGAVQNAIDHAYEDQNPENSDIIVIPPATFHENLKINKNITLTSDDPDDWRIVEATIIDGQGCAKHYYYYSGSAYYSAAGRGTVEFDSGCTSDCILVGLTITGGFFDGFQPDLIDPDNKPPVPKIEHGAGIQGYGCSATITDCIIRDNKTLYGSGGGIQNFNGLLENCVITGNFASASGGGIAGGFTAQIRNCLISNNTAGYGGGLNNCPNVINCTIANNTASASPGGISWSRDDCTPIVTNSIVWGNCDKDSTTIEEAQINEYPGFSSINPPTVTYSCIQDEDPDDPNIPFGGSANHNIDDPPSFLNSPEFCESVTDVEIINGAFKGSPNDDTRWKPEDGRFGGAMQFDGYDDYIYVGDTSASVKTVAFWVNVDSIETGNTDYPIDLNGTDYIYIDSGVVDTGGFASGRKIYVDGSTQSSTITAGNWHHIAVTTDTDDGINADNLDIGRKGDNYYAGLIDDVRIYEEELTAGQVKRLAKPPVAHWKLDEGVGTMVRDSSLSDYHGTLKNFPTDDSQKWVLEEEHTALKFDGYNDYVQIAGYKGITGDNPRTCTAWVKDGLAAFISWGSDDEYDGGMWTFRVGGSNCIGLGVYGGCVWSQIALSDGQWHHVAAVLPDQESPKIDDILLYINGELDPNAAPNVTGIDINTGSDLDVLVGARIEGMQAWDPEYFDGYLDDVRIYDYAMDSNEISDLFSLTAKMPIPVLHLRLDEPSYLVGEKETSSSWIDYTGNDFSTAAVSDASVYEIGGIIEAGNDGIIRRVIDVDIDNYKVKFSPPLSTENSFTLPMIYLWGSNTNLFEDYHLLTGSPCIDAGNNDVVVWGYDIDGDSRKIDGDYDDVDEVDMGADEHVPLEVAYWKLDEIEQGTPPTTPDATLSGLDGAVDGPTLDPNGHIDYAFTFDGTDDYVQITDYKGIIDDNPRTCAAWVKLDPDGGGGFLSWGSNQEVDGGMWTFRVNVNSNFIELGVYGGCMRSSVVLNDDEWYHIAAVLPDKDSPTLSDILLYIDGELDSNAAPNTTATIDIDTGDDLDVLIGARIEGIQAVGAEYFDGSLDDVRIYDIALSPKAIENLAGM